MPPRAPDPAFGVYVHFPWCQVRCPYCDFLSLTANGAIPHRAYADAVLAELERRAPRTNGLRVTSVFFGGGTPSLWEPSELLRVLHGIRRWLDTDAELEVTVEANPSGVTAGWLEALLAGGVNRLSVGVQSLNTDRLRFLGRSHDGPQALAALELCRRAGVPRLSADLIHGVAGQSPEEAAEEARRLADLGLGHLSTYALTVEAGTRFGQLARQGRLPLAPEDGVADAFLRVREALGRAGFVHYEISNHARPGQEARHHLSTWRGHPYLGLGLGAWGTVEASPEEAPALALRYRNLASLERYLAIPWRTVHPWSEAADGALAVRELLDGPTLFRERLMLGLRLAEGVDAEPIAAAMGVELWTSARTRRVAALERAGRLHRSAGRWRIPPEAWLLADDTIARLL